MLSTLLFGDSSEESSAQSDAPDQDDVPDLASAADSESEPASERRGSQRAPSRCLVRIWNDAREKQPVFGRLEDLSESGCRLLTETTFEVGEEISIEVTVLGRTPRITIEATGTVKHRDQSSARRAYGIEFAELGPSTERAMLWLYDREKTLHPLNTRPGSAE